MKPFVPRATVILVKELVFSFVRIANELGKRLVSMQITGRRRHHKVDLVRMILTRPLREPIGDGWMRSNRNA